jgi:D-lactate dehydrogenase
MKVAVFDTHKFDRSELESANGGRYELDFIEARLSMKTADLATGCDAICCFVNDCVDSNVIQRLKQIGVRMIAIRGAGYNNVDIEAARRCEIGIARVPEYSPHAVAEHAVALLLCLNRKIHHSHARVRELNFSLDGLVGFDLAGKTVGVIGTGRIGRVFAKIMRGFDCRVLASDVEPDAIWAKEVGVEYVELDRIFKESDVISLHVPLTPKTHHLIAERAFELMKKSAYLINTGRGALIETSALIKALKQKRIGGVCLDVYEQEGGVFFSDMSECGIDDDLLARLTTFPNVLITAHQAFLTHEALSNIAHTTISNLEDYFNGRKTKNQL